MLLTLTSSQQVCPVNSGPTHAGMYKVVPTEKPMRVHTSQPKGVKVEIFLSSFSLLGLSHERLLHGLIPSHTDHKEDIMSAGNVPSVLWARGCSFHSGPASLRRGYTGEQSALCPTGAPVEHLQKPATVTRVRLFCPP